MTPAEERQIVEQVKNGDKNAFEVLLIGCQNEVYALALKMLGNPDDALDVSQDAFLRAYTNIAKFRGDARFSVWMYRITYNLCLDKIRRTKRRAEVSIETEEGEPSLQLPDTTPGPEERTVTRETAELVRRGVGMLPPKLRGALIMREVTGLSYAEIAQALKISEGTVKSRLNRARAALADYLKKHGTFSDTASQNVRKGGEENA